MFAGYNTDVSRGGVVVHVQTEDKGDSDRYIESMIYVGGQILATSSYSYASLLESGEDISIVGRLMSEQHRAMITAVKEGQLDEKLEGFVASGSEEPDNGVEGEEAPKITLVAEDLLAEDGDGDGDGRVGVVGEAEEVAADAEHEAVDAGPLVIEHSAEPQLALGTESKLRVELRNEDGSPVAEARVLVELITTVSKPRTLAFGATDEAGAMDVLLDVPELEGGFAALVVNASTDTRTAELKLLL